MSELVQLSTSRGNIVSFILEGREINRKTGKEYVTGHYAWDLDAPATPIRLAEFRRNVIADGDMVKSEHTIEELLSEINDDAGTVVMDAPVPVTPPVVDPTE